MNGGDNRQAALLTILQIANASFPTGAFSHSYGFETWLADGSLTTPEEAEAQATLWLRYGVSTGDGAAVALAHRCIVDGDFERLVALNRRVGALKLTRETREASLETGAAWIEACRQVFDPDALRTLESVRGGAGAGTHYSVAFGLVTAALGMTETDAVETYLFSTFSNLIAVLGRLLPIGQARVQQIIARARPGIEAMAEEARSRSPASMASQYAALDAASMRHERINSRLCIS